jgi:hypothetical protein
LLVHFIWPGIQNKLETDLKMWMNHTLHWKTPVHQAGLQDAMQVYTGLSPKKTLKKPNLGESLMKTVFSSYSSVVVMTAILAP